MNPCHQVEAEEAGDTGNAKPEVEPIEPSPEVKEADGSEKAESERGLIDHETRRKLIEDAESLLVR